jgi:mRNA interferase MazF
MELTVGDVVLCEFYFADTAMRKKRPVLIFKDNLPYDDFIAIPISSQLVNLYQDEQQIELKDFSSGSIPKTSKVMIRKTMVVSKQIVIKKYGTLNKPTLKKLQQSFCHYFGCNTLGIHFPYRD